MFLWLTVIDTKMIGKWLNWKQVDLGKEDGGGSLINDDCDKYNDGDCDDSGDNTSCNISIINFENL